MKLLYTTMYSALLMGAIGFNATAQQQLPNSGFQEAWVTCNPWIGGSSTNVGTTPTDWCISNVAGYKFLSSWMGKTEVGENVEGYNSTSAVSLTSKLLSIGTLVKKNIPAYITLGTSWNTANTSGAEADGGSWGGKAFSDRPTGLQFMYKRTDNKETKTASSVVAYLWKGTYVQANVPVSISSSPTTVNMENRDRNILEMETSKGGEITSKGERIAVINTTISGEATEWTKFSAKFNYESESTPEMINVILAAGDYFASAADVVPNVNLTIDNVRVFYEYNGYLNISMDPFGALATNKDATIEIVPTGDNKCTFTLPNFKLEIAGNELNLGNIVVNNVTISNKDGKNYYEGSVEGLTLPEGAPADEAITANVLLSGTTDNMKIDVDWIQDPTDPTAKTPIEVTFTKDPVDDKTGISDITIDNSNAPVEFYNLQGVRVSGDNLTPGIYVRRQGSAVSKVLVK